MTFNQLFFWVALVCSFTVVNCTDPRVAGPHAGVIDTNEPAARLGRGRFSFNAKRDTPSALPLIQQESVVFLPDFVKREAREILLKYGQADMFLKGLGLVPSLIDDETAGLSVLPLADVSGDPRNGSVRLRDYFSSSGQDILYYGPMGVGSPPQQLTVIPDTGSADLWFPCHCSGCTARQFDDSRSVTYSETTTDFQIAYGAGYAYGKLASDTVTMAGLAVETQYFGAVDSEAADFSGYPNSGVLGMAFGSISRSGKPPFFESLVKAGQVNSPVFSIGLVRSDGDSELCIGCINEEKYFGNIRWLDVRSKTYWTVAMTGLNINGLNTMSSGLLAAVDSGTSQIYVPDAVAVAFYAAIPGSREAPQYGSGFWTFPCNSKAEISISFDGIPFTVHPFDFNLGRTSPSSQDCVGGILGMDSDHMPDYFAIVGAALLKSWYAVFDYTNGGRVGLARSSSR